MLFYYNVRREFCDQTSQLLNMNENIQLQKVVYTYIPSCIPQRQWCSYIAGVLLQRES